MVSIDAILPYLWGFIGVSVVGFFLWWFYYIRQFNKLVYIRDEALGGHRVFFDKARIYVNKKEKVVYWQLQKTKLPGRGKICLPPPQAEAITLTFSGQQMAELLRTGPDDYKWISYKEMVKDDSHNPFPKALTTTQKQAMVNQFAIAVEESTTQGNKLLEKFLPIIVIAILLVFGYLYMDMYMKKSQEMMGSISGVAAQQAEIAKQNAELIKTVKDIIEQRQTLTPDSGVPKKPTTAPG